MIDADGKRLAAIFAAMEPVLGRATIGYLRLFKPAKTAKTALRTARAIKIVADLDALVRVGNVCRDERRGLRRPTTALHLAAGIEQVLIAPPNGLPLTNHHYLCSIVYGLADQADAVAERSRETVRDSIVDRKTAEVWLAIDSQNRAGAMLRSKAVCYFHDQGKPASVDSIEFLDIAVR